MRFWIFLAAAGLLAGCTSVPPERLVFGVSRDRPAAAASEAADAEMRKALDWKANQICTQGYKTVKVDTLTAEEDRQIVDEELRCNRYRLSLF
jgi:hypothetical protein